MGEVVRRDEGQDDRKGAQGLIEGCGVEGKGKGV